MCSSATFCDPINYLIFLDVNFLDSILSRTVVLGKVWWGPDHYHVKYIAWSSPHFSKYCRARLCSFNGGRLWPAQRHGLFKENVRLFCILGVGKTMEVGGPYRVRQSMSSHVEHRFYDFADHSMSCLSVSHTICIFRYE